MNAEKPWTGGAPEDAFRYWRDHGFTTAHQYPYLHGICKMREMIGGSGETPTEENLKAVCEAADICFWNHTEWTSVETFKDFWIHRGPQPCQNIVGLGVPNEGELCKAESENVIGKIRGYFTISNTDSLDEERMKKALYLLGPLAIGMNVLPLVHYKGGIVTLDSQECDPNELDHSLELVGYGTENGIDYWKVRNSWTPFFGEKGFLRVQRNRNICGIAANVEGIYI